MYWTFALFKVIALVVFTDFSLKIHEHHFLCFEMEMFTTVKMEKKKTKNVSKGHRCPCLRKLTRKLLTPSRTQTRWTDRIKNYDSDRGLHALSINLRVAGA